MARGLNKVMLIGNLGSDPEIKYAASGTAIANFRLATSENRKNREGEWEEETEWHRIVIFGKQAEFCKDYLRKGSKVFIEGRIQTRSWDDQSGQKKYSTEIIGLSIILLEPKGVGGTAETAGTKGAAISHSTGNAIPESPPEDIPDADDDLPF